MSEPRTIKGLLLQMKLGNHEESILAEETVVNRFDDLQKERDQLTEVNKVLVEALEKIEIIVKPTIKVFRRDGEKLESVLIEVREALAKAKEMSK